jgi:DNA polymerase III subunit chi
VTQVDFYVLPSDSADARLLLACRIADKALQQRQHVLINTDSPGESARLDDLLWTFSQGSFIPHRVIAPGASAEFVEPVLIGCGVAPETEDWHVLINLAQDVPEFFSRYQRVAELVDGNEQRREQGRMRFRFYRDRGYELNTHRM